LGEGERGGTCKVIDGVTPLQHFVEICKIPEIVLILEFPECIIIALLRNPRQFEFETTQDGVVEGLPPDETHREEHDEDDRPRHHRGDAQFS
jgi:hypothetical protein